MSETLNLVILTAANWLHLVATVVWIGGMATNILNLLPSMRETLEPPVMGKLMGAVMKRFRKMIYFSIATLVVTGVVINLFHESSQEIMPMENLWNLVILIKLVVTTVLIFIAVYAFESLAPKMGKLAAKGPSPELARLQKFQIKLAVTGFMLGLLILLLTGLLASIP